jgi:Tripartite tricarboxylate transporter family receptor
MKLPHRRQFLHLAAGAAALPAVSHVARAQAYPARPMRWIVGFPPGGGADTVARIIAPWLSERLGQQVVIENRPGAGTNIAVQAVVNSPPDGYTLLWFGLANVINVSIFPHLPFDFLRDITPVCGLVVYPMVLVAHPSFPANTVAELIAHAKVHPGKVSMASFGTGTTSHLAGEMFKMMAGTLGLGHLGAAASGRRQARDDFRFPLNHLGIRSRVALRDQLLDHLDRALDLLVAHSLDAPAVLDLRLARHEQRKYFEVHARLVTSDLLDGFLALMAEVQQQRLHELLVQEVTRAVPVAVRVKNFR